jgi:hypothetical protein
MTEKTTIVAHLDERPVLLPQLLSRALDANERANCGWRFCKMRFLTPNTPPAFHNLNSKAWPLAWTTSHLTQRSAALV